MTTDETPCNLATTFFLIPRSHCQVVNCSLLWVQGIVVGLKRLTVLRYICPRKLNNSLRTQVKEVKSRKHEKVVAYGKNQEISSNWTDERDYIKLLPNKLKLSVKVIWNKSYMNCGNEMKVKKWMASFRNCINCVHCDDHFFISFPQFIFALNSSGRWSRKIRRFCRGRHLRPGQMIWEEKTFWHTSGVVESFYLKETE